MTLGSGSVLSIKGIRWSVARLIRLCICLCVCVSIKPVTCTHSDAHQLAHECYPQTLAFGMSRDNTIGRPRARDDSLIVRRTRRTLCACVSNKTLSTRITKKKVKLMHNHLPASTCRHVSVRDKPLGSFIRSFIRCCPGHGKHDLV